jgi:hypothetical protein
LRYTPRSVSPAIAGACDDEVIHGEATEFGCVAYLKKPFSSHLLIEAIVKAIDRSSGSVE